MIRMRAALLPEGSPLHFATNPADDMTLNATLVFLDDDPVPTAQIEYGTLTLTVSTGTIENIVVAPGNGSTTQYEVGPVGVAPLAEPLSESNDAIVESVLPLAGYTSPTESAFGQVDRSSDSWWYDVEDEREELALVAGLQQVTGYIW